MNRPQHRLTSLEQIRFDKLKALESAGILCYPNRYDRQDIASIRTSVDALLPSTISELTGTVETWTVAIAGRIMWVRKFGNLVFLDIKWQSGDIQIALESSRDLYLLDGKWWAHKNMTIWWEETSVAAIVQKYFDIGDFIWANGQAFKNKKWEPTLLVTHIQLLSKSISPLPEKHYGLKDQEERYRKRYLDMLDPEVQNRIVRRSKYFSSMRRFFEDAWFLELDTPRLENTTGWADARPFQTHYNAYDTDVFLRISAWELWQKRLMAWGFEKTFEIWPVFRNEWVSPEHAQDYMQMEVYWAYADYKDMMGLIKNMYLHVIDHTYGKRKFSIHGHEVDFDKEWEVLDYQSLIKDRTGIDIFTSKEEEMIEKLKEIWAHYEAGNRPRLVDYLWKSIRKTITWPAFLINEPKFTSPLAKSSPSNPEITERFHIIIAWSEVWNGYSELNDPVDQFERFENQQAMRDAWDDEAQMADLEFVEMLKHGMPPTAGFWVSERFFAFLEGLPIRECQTFPYVKRV